jgi:hypothetical protein
MQKKVWLEELAEKSPDKNSQEIVNLKLPWYCL